MWIFFFCCALLGSIILTIHIILQFNDLDKEIQELTQKVYNHYGFERN